MSKRPSELNVVDRIFYDIQVHGIASVLNNKEFYQNYEPSKLRLDAVIKNEVAVCKHHKTCCYPRDSGETCFPQKGCFE